MLSNTVTRPTALHSRLIKHIAARMSSQYTVADVAKHKDESNGMWIIVDSGVYDITSE